MPFYILAGFGQAQLGQNSYDVAIEFLWPYDITRFFKVFEYFAPQMGPGGPGAEPPRISFLEEHHASGDFLSCSRGSPRCLRRENPWMLAFFIYESAEKVTKSKTYSKKTSQNHLKDILKTPKNCPIIIQKSSQNHLEVIPKSIRNHLQTA